MSHQQEIQSKMVSELRPRPTLRAGIYARSSASEQVVGGKAIEDQLRAAREFVTRRRWEIAREYVDPGYSGNDDERPAFQKIINDAERGKIDVIVVYQLNRFSRSLSDILLYFDVLGAAEVYLASVDEPFDFTTTVGKAQFYMMMGFAQWYLDVFSAGYEEGSSKDYLD